MNLVISSYCKLKDNKVTLDDRLIFYQDKVTNFSDFAKQLYKQSGISYGKFYKMDAPCKLGFLMAELVLQRGQITACPNDRVGVILYSASGCLDTDLIHQQSINDRSAYFPSPSVFVYTLPNIVAGEISIRHQIKGETACFIQEDPDCDQIFRYIEELFASERVDACLCGWYEVMGPTFSAVMFLVENQESSPVEKEFPGQIAKPFMQKYLNELFN
jgi:hypothetical protein